MKVAGLLLVAVAILSLITCTSRQNEPPTQLQVLQPTPDFPATVEASVGSTLEAEAAIEATVQAKVATFLTTSQSTATPWPTTTPWPTAAPYPTSTPSPINASLLATLVAAQPTPTPQPTLTLQPTLTPRPTETTRPTPTTPTPNSTPKGTYRKFLIGEGSRVTFTVAEELVRAPLRSDTVISSTGLRGVVNLDGQPSIVTLDLHSLSSDQDFRDQYIRNRLFPDTPEAAVTVDQLPDLSQSFFDGEETTGELSGSLQIDDTITPLVFEVTARHDGDVINVLGKTTFTWEQLGLAKPTTRSVVYLGDEVSVQILLVAWAR